MEETDKEVSKETSHPTNQHVVEANSEMSSEPLPSDSPSVETRSVSGSLSDGGSCSDLADLEEEEDEELCEGAEDEEDEGSVILEREEGDGQESAPNKKVDDDEDKRNPQYIPKRGTFYEHDDRTATEQGDEEEKPEEIERSDKESVKKKVWSEKESSRWSHDRFNEQEQAPKSRTELVSVYGYDIRNEEGPPRARRRRRYGRGPNKYTRNWEDEDAYNKAPAPTNRVPRKKKSKEEFPSLENQRNKSKSSDKINIDSENSKENINVQQDNGNRIEIKEEPKIQPNQKSQINRNETTNMKQPVPRKEIKDHRNPPPMRSMKPNYKPEEVPRGIVPSRGATRSRGFRGAGRGEPRNRNQEESSDYILTQNFTNKNLNQVEQVEKEMANVSLQEGYTRGGKFGGQRQASVPPRLQAEQRGSKRYSSLRQRSLPETAGAQQATFSQQQHVIHYATEYGQQTPPQQTQQPILPHATPTIVPSTNNQPIMTNTQPMGPPMAHQVPPSTGGQILQAPPLNAQYANHFTQGPPPFVAPPTFIQQQGISAPPPQIINYQPPQFPQEYANFQHQQFAAVNQGQPAELYQSSQGGITYYSMQNQQVVPRVQTKRPKAAIPIVPPPPMEHKEPRGRGRLNQLDEGTSQVGGAPSDTPKNYQMESVQYAADVIVQQ